jgi:tripartite ATP-independent transporter DctM subunit
MDYNSGAAICIALMLLLLVIGVPIAWALLSSSIVVGFALFGPSALDKLGGQTFYFLYSLAWTPLPLFVLLGCLISETTIGFDLFKAARNWLSRVPGGLVSATIWAEAGMAAALGASAPCIVGVGKIAIPELERFHYKKSFALGALLTGGILGPLIPPSAVMIIFAILTNASVGRLFIAGVIPGLILAVLLSVTPILLCLKNPSLGLLAGSVSWKERWKSLGKIWPMILIILSILGTIYFGIATPTEAAGVGCVVVLILAVAMYHMRWQALRRALMEAAMVNAMLMISIIGAQYFSYIIGSSSLTRYLTDFIHSSNLSPWAIVVCINIILLILGCFLDGMTIMLLTIPILVPILTRMGFDPLWIGVWYVVNMEIGLITPPMGINLFLTSSVFKISNMELIKAALPFLAVCIAFLALILAFPQLSLWLPGVMFGK